MGYNPVQYWNDKAIPFTPTHGEPESPVSLSSSLLEMIDRYGHAVDFLDIGSGRGRLCKLITDHIPSARYFMCDISVNMAQLAHENTGHHPTLYQSHLPYANNSFDWVLSFSVLLHVKPINILNMLKELARVSKRHVFISTYTGTDKSLAPHCFSHDYYELFHLANLWIKEERIFKDRQQTQWVLSKH